MLDALLPPEMPVVELGVPASIPQEYIDDLTTRLGIYHRLATLSKLAEVDDLERELADRFGPVPVQTQDLLYLARLRMQAAAAEVESIVRRDAAIVLQLKDEVGGAGEALRKTLGEGFSVGNTQVRMGVSQHRSGWQAPLAEALDRLATFRERAASLHASV